MGQFTDATIEEFQKAKGIEPAIGERARILTEISDAAFGLIKIIELEKSGIRDGDGYWLGSDPVGHTMWELRELFDRLDAIDGVSPPPDRVVRLGDSFLCTPRHDDGIPF
jgi:hypothetical protein